MLSSYKPERNREISSTVIIYLHNFVKDHKNVYESHEIQILILIRRIILI